MKQLSILAVDDDENFLYTLSEILRLHNWMVDIAGNGFKAIELVKQKSYDLVLLDVRMPGIDGIKTFNEIKKLQPQALILMVTGEPVGDLQDLLKQGVHTIISKPINVIKVIDVISNLQKRGTILVVDDDENDRNLLSDILIEKGYRVLTAKTGTEAIALTRNGEFDVVLLDIRLPDMTGIEVLKDIKRYNPAMSVIVVTGYSLDGVVEQIVEEGAYTCFLKPFNVEMLLQDVNNIVTKEESFQKEESADISKVLVVEDNDDIRETTQEILQEKGFTVQTASSLQEAKEIIEKETFSVVISDLSLGKDSGLSLVELVRRKDPLTTFILITGQGTLETALEAIKKEVDEYILKPIKPEELIHKVKTHLEKQKLAKDKESLVKKIQESNIKLLELSKTDELTGVFNRRCLFEQLHSEMERTKRQNTPLCLMMCDVDGFKKYNDNYGHIEGDKLLKEIAKVIRLGIRCYVDQVFRYGGDEFAIIVPGIDEQVSLSIAERIIAKIKDTPHTKSVGISIGISCFSTQNQHLSLNEFIDLADKKLYEAKKSGRNKAIV